MVPAVPPASARCVPGAPRAGSHAALKRSAATAPSASKLPRLPTSGPDASDALRIFQWMEPEPYGTMFFFA